MKQVTVKAYTIYGVHQQVVHEHKRYSIKTPHSESIEEPFNQPSTETIDGNEKRFKLAAEKVLREACSLNNKVTPSYTLGQLERSG